MAKKATGQTVLEKRKKLWPKPEPRTKCDRPNRFFCLLFCLS